MRSPVPVEQRSRELQRYYRLKAAGRCVQCRRPTTTGTLCRLHRKEHSAQNQTWQEQRRARGLCPSCGGVLTVNPATGLIFVLCLACRVRDRKRRKARPYHAAYVRGRQASGLCERCGAPSSLNPATGKPFWKCRPCRLQESARESAA